MKEAIRQRAIQLGFEACRFGSADPPATAPQLERWLAEGRHGRMEYLRRNAEKRVNPAKVLPGARSLVSLAVSYASAVPEPPSGQAKTSDLRGVIARYARYPDYHDVLAPRLKELTSFIDAQAGPATRSLWYVDTGPVLERDLAQRAGLGFIGKHTNLIHRQLGNWIFLCEILTTAELAPDEPERNRCGSCTRCLAACPTNAIVAPFELDARRCISYLTIELKESIPLELRPAIGLRIYGCDDCLAACPWNRFAREGQLLRGQARADLATPDLLELLALDDLAFRQRFDGTPLRRLKRRGLLRNVCVALGNLGDPAALPALARAALDAEPLIAEHARWAIERIEHPPGSDRGSVSRS